MDQFLLVADIRGCKGVTRGNNPYECLKTEYAGMDWDHAMQRENGQLVLDLGITFHPNPADETPLVGLWRLDVMRASYAKAGATKSMLHPACTLQGYGGLQATIEQRRGVSCPNCVPLELHAQLRGNPSTIGKALFLQGHRCIRHILRIPCLLQQIHRDLCRGSRSKSFGVRHEIRASGPAVTEAPDTARTKVSELVTSSCCTSV